MAVIAFSPSLFPERSLSRHLTRKRCRVHHSPELSLRSRVCSARSELTNSSEFQTLPPLFQPPGKEGFLFGAGIANSWDSGGVGPAIVRRYSGDVVDRWCMWYQGWNPETLSPEIQNSASSLTGLALAGVAPSRVGLATSSNGIHWSRGAGAVETDARGVGDAGMVLEPNPDWWTFDTHHVSVSDVLIMSSEKVRSSGGVYWMYYSGGDKADVAIPEEMTRLGRQVDSGGGIEPGTALEGLGMRPGLAMSSDGMNWARIEGDHHSWSLFDVGEEGDWDALFVGSPQVVFHKAGDIRMYYHSFSLRTRKYTVGFARSRDGIKWVKYGKCVFFGGNKQPGSFDELGIKNRHVIEDPSGGDGYIMVYEGVDENGISSIGLARSKDGLWDWERVGDAPIFRPSENPTAWDCKSVGAPCLVDMGDGRWRLYYVGVSEGGVQGIGLAESSNSDFTSFRRWQSGAIF